MEIAIERVIVKGFVVERKWERAILELSDIPGMRGGFLRKLSSSIWIIIYLPARQGSQPFGSARRVEGTGRSRSLLHIEPRAYDGTILHLREAFGRG